MKLANFEDMDIVEQRHINTFKTKRYLHNTYLVLNFLSSYFQLNRPAVLVLVLLPPPWSQ